MKVTSRQDKASKRSCLFTFIFVFVVIPLLLIALVLSLWFARESTGRKLLQAKIANLKKNGYPVDDATVDAFYKGRTDPTNTDDWLTILAIIHSPKFEASTKGVPLLGVSEGLPKQLGSEWKEEAAAIAFLEKWRSLSDELLRLSIDAKAVRFPIVFDSFKSIDMNRLQAFRTLARILDLRCVVAMRDGDSAGVRDAVAGMYGLSRALSGEPLLVSQLVSIAIDGMAIGSLKDALKNDVLGTADLQFLLPRTMELANIAEDWETAFAGERAFALPLFSDPKRARASGIPLLFSNSRDAAFYVDVIEEMLAVPTDELIEFKSRIKEVENKMRGQSRASWLALLEFNMTMQTIPAFEASGEAFIRRALQHRIAALAISLRLHEDINGKLPSSLDELSEIKKIEIFSPSKNQRFGYRLEGSDAQLWGGSFRDAFSIPSEPPKSEDDQDTTVSEFWTWELPAMTKP